MSMFNVMSMFKSIGAVILPGLIGAAGLLAMPVAAGAVEADGPVRFDAALGQRAAAKGKTIYLRINLEGIAAAQEGRRLPVNVGLVIDRSGSMEDDNKIGAARDAALQALARLSTSDFASVVAFDSDVEVLMPAGRLESQTEIRRIIERLQAGGHTALYAGTEQGLRQVEKFRDRERVNRLILISDGLANVGPSEPREIAELGRKAAQRGITISTIGLGLGYNEDVMTKLAYSSDGNHAFVERPEQLVEIFNREFGTILSVVAQEIIIEVNCRNGVKPLRFLGRDGAVNGDRAEIKFAQLYSKQQKYALVELQLPNDAAAGDLPVADVTVRYAGTGTAPVTLTAGLSVTITADEAVERASLDKSVMNDVAIQLATAVQEEAVSLRDAGRIEDAKKLLGRYADQLDVQAATAGISSAAPLASELRSDIRKFDDEENWNSNRKGMRAKQHKNKVQQAY